LKKGEFRDRMGKMGTFKKRKSIKSLEEKQHQVVSRFFQPRG